MQTSELQKLLADHRSQDPDHLRKDPTDKTEHVEHFAAEGTVFHNYEELRGAGSRPQYVDPKQKEVYLRDDEFEKVFGMSKAEFHMMPKWKQHGAKKKVDLF